MNKYRLSVIGYRLSGQLFNHIAKTFIPPSCILQECRGENHRKPNTEKGVVLIFTLVMVAVLSALAVNLSSKMNKEILLLKNSSDYLKASAMALGGTHYAFAMIKMDDDLQVDWLGEDWAEEIMLAFDENVLRVNITDESGKINANYLDKNSGKEKKLRIEQMLELCDEIGLEYAVVPAIIDWLDADNEITEILSITVGENKGAESEYYEDLPFPYPCKNKPLDITEELMLVRGITKKNYYGEKGLGNFVTVFSGEKININTASAEVLKSTIQAALSSSSSGDDAEISDEVDDIAIASIIDWRIDNAFYDILQLREFFSQEAAKKISAARLFDVKSSFFRIASSAKVGKIEKTITAIAERDQSSVMKIIYWDED